MKATKVDGRFLWTRDGSILVWVEPGPFLRGNDKGDPDEAPATEVRTGGFFIDRFEVTNGQYRKFYAWWVKCAPGEKRKFSHRDEPEAWDHRPAFWPSEEEGKPAAREEEAVYGRDEIPVVGISWYSAFAYARWCGKDLPTETEWEKAASHEGKSKGKRLWPWGNGNPDFTRCNFAGNVGRRRRFRRSVSGSPGGT